MNSFWHVLYAAAVMFWETLWALILGFSLSAFLRWTFLLAEVVGDNRAVRLRRQKFQRERGTIDHFAPTPAIF